MKARMVRWIFGLGIMAFLAMTTWPGVYMINRIEPLVLGLPFNLFAIALLIVVALGLLTALYLSEDQSGDK
ncbi:MAG: hypothetical protein AAGI28_15170 [Pseudomonadota bacterium]